MRSYFETQQDLIVKLKVLGIVPVLFWELCTKLPKRPLYLITLYYRK